MKKLLILLSILQFLGCAEDYQYTAADGTEVLLIFCTGCDNETAMSMLDHHGETCGAARVYCEQDGYQFSSCLCSLTMVSDGCEGEFDAACAGKHTGKYEGCRMTHVRCIVTDE